MSSPLQDENIRLTKKPRLGEPLSASLDEAAAKMSSHGTAESLPAAAAAATDRADADPVDAYLVKGIRAKVRWTSGEDAKLNSAVTSICKKKYDKGDTTDWAAVAALVPGRLGNQCYTRWRDALDPTIDRTNKRRGKWAEDEDIKLKDAVQTRGAKNWPAIAALVPGRTKNQSYDRWHNVLDPRINRANSRVGIWAEEEDIKLKDAVQTHGGKKWGAVASLVPSRTKKQCWSRWHDVLNPSIALAAGREGSWTAVEDSELKDAVQTHGGKNWAAITVLVPGRTKTQCRRRWKDVLDPSVDRANGRRIGWTEDEASKLKNAVQTHGGNNWSAVAALVPGRSAQQCKWRWHRVLVPTVGRADV
jgi:hypothetical protein